MCDESRVHGVNTIIIKRRECSLCEHDIVTLRITILRLKGIKD